MKLKYILFTWCGFLRLNSLVEGVECYVCGGTGKDCPEFNPPISRLETKTCPEEYAKYGMFAACYKEIFHSNDTVTVGRACGYVYRNHPQIPCDQETDRSPQRCWCTDNYCNAATPSNWHVPRTLLGLCVLGSVFIASALN